MKISGKELEKIIKEEVSRYLSEQEQAEPSAFGSTEAEKAAKDAGADYTQVQRLVKKMFANKQIENDIESLKTPAMKAQFYALLFTKYVQPPNAKLMSFMTQYIVPAIKEMQGGGDNK